MRAARDAYLDCIVRLCRERQQVDDDDEDAAASAAGIDSDDEDIPVPKVRSARLVACSILTRLIAAEPREDSKRQRVDLHAMHSACACLRWYSALKTRCSVQNPKSNARCDACQHPV